MSARGWRRRGVLAAAGAGAAGALLPAAQASAVVPIQPGPDGLINICWLGDSYIAGSDSTDGNGCRKVVMDALIINNESRNVRCVGSQASTGTGGGYGYTVPLVHEGHPGWTSAQLLSLVNGGGLNYAQGRPHIVVLMAGANDFGAGYSPTAVCTRLTALLDAVLASTSAGVVLCENVLMSSYKSSVLTNRTRQAQELNAMLPALVDARADRVVLARTSLLDQQDINTGGVHPTDGGYQRLGAIVYEALRPWFGRDGRWLVPIRSPWAPGPNPLGLS